MNLDPRTKPYFFAGLAFVAAWLVLSWPWLSGAVTIPWDAKAHFYPQLQFLAQAIHRGGWPFWTPYMFSGHPQVADPQSLIFSPPYLALAALSPDPGFSAADGVLLGMLGLGALAVLALFRDRGWHPTAALVAALVFAFGASAAWRIQHVGQVLSLAWWPIALWLLSRALERGSARYGFAAGIVAGFMALGRDQVAYLGLLLLLGFVAAQVLSAPARAAVLRRSAKPLLAGALGGVLVVALPLLFTLLLALDSNRPAIDLAGAGRGSLHPALLLTWLVPNLYGADGPFLDYWGPPSPLWGPVDLAFARNMGVIYLGAAPAALILIGLSRGVLFAREIRFVAVAGLLVLLYALGRYTPAFAVMFHIPGVDLFRRPGDATFFIGAIGAILAGYVMHRALAGTLPRARRGQRALELAALAVPFGIGLALALTKGTLHTASWPLAKAALFLAASLALIALLLRSSPQRKRVAAALVAAFLGVVLATNNDPNESTALPPADFAMLRPDGGDPMVAALAARAGDVPQGDRLDRVELAGLGFPWPNASQVHRFHNTLGYDPVRLRLYTEATGAEDHVALPDQRKFSPLFPSYRSTLVDLLGLRWIATGGPVEAIDRKLKPGDLVKVATIGDQNLYENPRAMPRALFATEARQADFEAILKTGEWPETDFSRTVLLGEPVTAAATALPAGPAAVRILEYAPTRIEIEVEAPRSGHLVLNDPWHPWWFAEVDGVPAAIHRANVLFRAVAIERPGRHRVVFTFAPLRGAWAQVAARK